jgi:hypothetical protein
MAGKLTLRARGKVFVRSVVVPKGEPANFPDEAELRAKFAGLADAVLGAGPAAALAEEVLRLDRLHDVSTVLQRAAPAGGRSAAA